MAAWQHLFDPRSGTVGRNDYDRLSRSDGPSGNGRLSDAATEVMNMRRMIITGYRPGLLKRVMSSHLSAIELMDNRITTIGISVGIKKLTTS